MGRGKSFGPPAKMDGDLVSYGGERATFLLSFIRERGVATITQMTVAWAEHNGVIDRTKHKQLRKRIRAWVLDQVDAGNLEAKGTNGDDHGSVLYGFPARHKP